MRKYLIASAATLALALPAFAASQADLPFDMDTVLGTNAHEVRASLAEMGLDVRKAEMEDGNIEVYFLQGDSRGEVYVSPRTGKPTKIKLK